MSELLIAWGVVQAVGFIFKPILEELSKDVVKDMAKNYVISCFGNVSSALHRKALTVATGRALKELLELIQNELQDADLSADELKDWMDDVKRFTRHKAICDVISALYLDPDYQLDPATFICAWQEISPVHTLPVGFSWSRIAKRFARKVGEIRLSSKELQDTFTAISNARMSDGIKQIAGLSPDFDLDAYRDALLERYDNLNFDSLDTTGAYYNGVRLWNVFVPQAVRENREYYPQLLEIPKEHQKRLCDSGELDAETLDDAEKTVEQRRHDYFNQPLKPVLEVTDDSTVQRMVILGDPGSGKSSLFRYLALRWAQIEDVNQRYIQPLPLLIELRDYSRWQCHGAKDFTRYLHEGPVWHRLNQFTLDQLLAEPNRVILLIDGLDEIFDPVLREQVVNDIFRFSNQYPEARIIVTSRVVGYKPQQLRDASFRHFMLQDLSPAQIDDFIDRWHNVTFDNAADAELKRERLRKAIHNSRPIAELAGNPLLLTMMAILNRNQELPRDRADLYQQASRVLLHQWDTERVLGEYPELHGQVGLREKTEMLRRIAHAMQSGPHGLAGNFITDFDLTGIIELYLHEELHFDQARAAAHAVVRQLRERNFILCYLGSDSYAFIHRTFLEYFCAVEFVHQFNIAKTLDIDGLIALFDQHCREDDWREVLRLICGQIDDTFVGQIVEHLATKTDMDHWDGKELLIELSLSLWCFSECRNLAKLETAGQRLMRFCIQWLKHVNNNDMVFGYWFNSVIPACQEIGEKWPGKALVYEYRRTNRDWFVYPGKHPWVTLIAAVDSDRSKLESLLDSNQEYIRASSLWFIAEKWPDEATRSLLTDCAVNDKYHVPRQTALWALAEKWPDETSRSLLTQRAFQDKGDAPRRAALEALAKKWPDETTRHLIIERAVNDGVASAVYGGMSSFFGHIVFTKDLDGIGHYVDPTEPLSQEHIQKAADKAGIPPEQIDETVRSLSEHMGWDITRGSGAKLVPVT